MRPDSPLREHGRHNEHRDDGGVSSVELAIIAPTLLALIFLILQGVFYFYGRSVALQAAREAVSQLRLQTYADCQHAALTVSDEVRTYASTVGSGALDNTSAKPDCGDANAPANREVTVTVHGESISLIGFSFHISETARSQVEQFEQFG